MADIIVGNKKQITIPAGQETTLVFECPIQHISLLNLSNTALFFRNDGGVAAIDSDECLITNPTLGITGYADLYNPFGVRRLSFISANVTNIQIYNFR